MNIAQIMSTELVTVGEEANLEQALQTMVRARVRHLLVVDGERLLGVITDRDLRFALPSRLSETDEGRRREFMMTTPVGAVCIRQPYTIKPETGVREAAQQMRDRRIGCLPVLEDDRPVGIVTVTDIIDALIQLLPPADPAASN